MTLEHITSLTTILACIAVSILASRAPDMAMRVQNEISAAELSCFAKGC